MNTPEFVKDKRTGIVLNIGGDFDQYQQKKNAIKAAKSTKSEIDCARREVAELRSEIREIKDLLKALVKADV